MVARIWTSYLVVFNHATTGRRELIWHRLGTADLIAALQEIVAADDVFPSGSVFVSIEVEGRLSRSKDER